MAEHGSLCLNSTEIMTDRQLCVYFTESAAAWACLKWVHNSDENLGSALWKKCLISQELCGIRTEHMVKNCLWSSYLQLSTICSIRIRPNSDPTWQNGEGLRKLDPGLTLITADFVSVSKWLADYDDYFTIRVAFDGLKNYHDKHIELFKTLSRFGDEPPQCIIIGLII